MKAPNFVTDVVEIDVVVVGVVVVEVVVGVVVELDWTDPSSCWRSRRTSALLVVD